MTDKNLELQWPWWRMFQLDKFISQVYLEIRVLKVSKHDEISFLIGLQEPPEGFKIPNSFTESFITKGYSKKIKGKDFVVVLVAKSHLTLWDPMDCSPPGSSVQGTSQARILEWVAFSSSRGSFLPRDQTWVSCIGREILYHWATRKARR